MNLGRILAQHLLPGDILAFWGDLGAGKTCLIQGICQGLGVSGDVYITSPTFVIMNQYKGRLPIYHFDFYRLSSKDEIIDLGYEEFFFGQGVSMIEWADRAEDLMPDDYFKVLMEIISPTDRKVEIIAYGIDCKKRLSHLNSIYKDMENFT
jgi:tRNA threonylcarbamoyladenosine biosynthesis protein TsaE